MSDDTVTVWMVNDAAVERFLDDLERRGDDRVRAITLRRVEIGLRERHTLGIDPLRSGDVWVGEADDA